MLTQNKRKSIPDALIETGEKYKTLFEGAADAIFVSEAKTGKIIDCNKKAQQLVNRPRQEIIGKPIPAYYLKRMCLRNCL